MKSTSYITLYSIRLAKIDIFVCYFNNLYYAPFLILLNTSYTYIDNAHFTRFITY